MTSRETTGLLAKAHGAIDEYKRSRSWAERLTLYAFYPLNAPWLAKSLYGGTKAQKRALLNRLGLPQDALPNLGSWKADVGLLHLVVDHILEAKPKVVVEFGAGASTLVVARALQMAGGGTHLAFDQHEDFVRATGAWLGEHGLKADLRAVPLRPSPDGWPGLWYDHGPLPDNIDFMLIDGPPWMIHPYTRGAAASLFGNMSVGGTVMLDDGARPGERIVARRWKRQWPNFDFELLKSGTKGTLLGVRRS